MGLRHHHSLIGSLNGLEHLHGTKAELRQPVRTKMHIHARRTGRCLDLHVGLTGYGLQYRGHFLRLGVEEIEVVPENIHHHRRGFARERLANAVAEEGQHFKLDAGKLLQHILDAFLHLFLSRSGDAIHEVHVKFTAMRSPGIFAELGASHLLFHGGNALDFEQSLGNLRSNLQHRRQ